MCLFYLFYLPARVFVYEDLMFDNEDFAHSQIIVFDKR